MRLIEIARVRIKFDKIFGKSDNIDAALQSIGSNFSKRPGLLVDLAILKLA